MAIYSNFDGTMRDAITIGKKGAVIKRVGTEDGISIEKSSAPGTYGTVTIATGTASNHAATKGQLDAHFGTGGTQVRNNTQLDARYPLLTTRNEANGYAGIGSDGKIESRFLPQIRLNKVIVKLNRFGRNAEPGLVAGDSCVITPTQLYDAGLSYDKDSVVRVMEYGITKFYAALRNTTPQTFDTTKWSSTTLAVGTTYNQGSVVLADNKLYVVTATFTYTSLTANIGSLSQYSDAAIREWSGGVPYAKDDIVKVTSPAETKYYSANVVMPAMDPADWTGTTLTANASYEIGDEVLYQNKNYMVRLAYTVPAVPVDPATVTDAVLGQTFIQDIAPDSGYYILSATPTYAADEDRNRLWVAAISSTTVDSFNGRIGPVSPQTGDYNANQISMPSYSDMDESTVQSNMRLLADRRVNRYGDKMLGALMISGSGTAAAPALYIPTSTKSGMYDDGGKIAFAIESTQKLAIGASGVVLGTVLDLNSNLISRVGDPQSASDGANKKYVDSKPLVLSGTTAPTTSVGKDGDVYLTILSQGKVTLPSTESWTDLASDGLVTMVVNTNSVPVAALTTNNGLSWTTSDMPAASNTLADQYAHVVSNNSDSFVAVRGSIDMSKTNGKLVYTTDRGTKWNQASTFAGTGSFIPASVYPDSTAYMLFPAFNSDVAYSSTNGDVWTPISPSLPFGAAWACAAGARGCYVAIESNTTVGSNRVVYQDFGNKFVAATMASTLVWKSVATADGVNYVAVGIAPGGNKNTNVVNYSNNRGETWQAATLPSTGEWSAVATNGTTFIAIRYGSNKAAYSSDNGRTWSEVTLPEVRNWSKLIGTTRMYMALATASSTNAPVAVSTDGGRTWTSDITGQIADINFKNSGEWLAYNSGVSGGGQSNASTSTLYVRRDGDKMTGSLVLSHDPSKDSIIASGAVLSPSLRATKYATNDMSDKEVGSIFVGSTNPDAVAVGSIFGYTTIVKGTSAGFSLVTSAQARAADGKHANVPMMTVTKDTFNMAGSVGLGGQNVAYAEAALAIDTSTKKHGVVVYSGDSETATTNTEILTIASNNSSLTKHAIKVRAKSITPPDASTNSPFNGGDYVFGVTTNGVVDILEALYVGGDRGVGQPTAKVAIKGASTYDSALDISNVTMPKKAGIQLRYNSYSNASNTYKHINVEEAAGTSVLLLDNNRFMVNKPVQLNTPTAKNISLYIGGTDAVRIPSGKTSERPAADDTEVGMMRYNTDNSRYEVYQGAAWQEIQAGRTSANMLELGTTWKPLASVDAEGHTHSFTIPAGADTSKGGFGATSWPFVQFQTKVAAGKFRSCTYDYEVSIPGYNIIVYATFASDAEAAAEDVRYFVSW